MKREKIGILGAGTWGTSLAAMLAERGYEVNLWAYEPQVARQINETRHNGTYLPAKYIPEFVEVFCDFESIFDNCEIIIECIPVVFLRKTMDIASMFWQKEKHVLVTTSKGLEPTTGVFPSQILQLLLPEYIPTVLGGPNFASEIAFGLPAGTVVASANLNHARRLRNIFVSDHFKVEITSDYRGVEVCGAFKNILAFAYGLAKGVGISENLLAYLLTKAMEEISVVAEAVGGCQKTVYGLAGFGDLFATSTYPRGRNSLLGFLIGKGKCLETVKKKFKVLPEGISSISAALGMSKKLGVRLPICQLAYDLVAGKISREQFFLSIEKLH